MNLSNLSFFDFAITVIGCVVTLFLGFPAYKRTKQLGFLLWCFSAFGSLWNTITLHTLGASPYTNRAAYIFTRYSYRILFIADGILGIIGTVLVIKSYLLLFEASQRDAKNSNSTPVA
jgi:hypothetical protein